MNVTFPVAVGQYKEQGFWPSPIVDRDVAADVGAQIDRLAGNRATATDRALDIRNGAVFQIYDVPHRPAPMSALCYDPRIMHAARQLLGDEPAVAWALLLNKISDSQSNWQVAWHQDTSVYCDAIPADAVGEQRGGFATFRPRDDSVGQLIVARIAIDPDNRGSGCLYVLPGTHLLGNQWLGGGKQFEGQKGTPIELEPGAVLFFNPLLMHRAGFSKSAHQRRIVHIYYRPARMQLPDGAKWIDWLNPAPIF